MQSTEVSERRGWVIPLAVLGVAAVLATIVIICVTLALQAPQREASKAIATQLLAPANNARSTQVEAAVHEAQTAVAQGLLSNPNLTDASQVPLTSAYPDVTVSAAGPTSGYTITARSTRTGYTYTYSSATGQYVGSQG